MVIVTLLLTGAIFTMNAQSQAGRQRDTEKQLQDIQEALLGFAIANGRLPRPAASATSGLERGPCINDPQCAGFIPWQTLGIGMSDPYGKHYRYSVTPAYAGGATGTDPINLTLVANRTIQTRNSLGALIYIAGSATCSAINPCVPAVVLSHGPQHHGTSSVDGTAMADGSITNADEDTNATSATNYIQRPLTDNAAATGGEFDDIVLWIPLTTLSSRLAQGGRL